MDELKLKIVTPDRVFYDGEIKSIVARGLEGDFMIMKKHVPFVTVLQISEMKITDLEGNSRMAAIAQGYLTNKNNEVVIMSNACEWADEIDIERAQRAKERAERRLKTASGDDVIKAEIALKRALNRLNVCQGK
ncbi:MAG: ATP synthase F1 subunit epsilon [Tissierellia bacterium]|nr:ATP synthase F1 subunit epsilon [Tissierellia bacterium]